MYAHMYCTNEFGLNENGIGQMNTKITELNIEILIHSSITVLNTEFGPNEYGINCV